MYKWSNEVIKSPTLKERHELMKQWIEKIDDPVFLEYNKYITAVLDGTHIQLKHSDLCFDKPRVR